MCKVIFSGGNCQSLSLILRKFLMFLRGVHNNRAGRAQAVATGAYLQNEPREHNKLLDTDTS